MEVRPLAEAPPELLADYRDLTDVALRRRVEPERGLYIAEGATVVRRAVAAGHEPRSVLTSERWLDSLEPLLEPWPATPVLLGTEAQLAEVAGFHVHRGALAAMHRPSPLDAAGLVAEARRIVVLEDVVSHTNVGAVFRSAAALGVDAVLVSPQCADPLYRRSIRVSMGTVFQVPWARLEPWPQGLGRLRESGFALAALTLADGSIPLDELAADPPERLAWMLGTEGDGLSREAAASADLAVTIPMAGGVDSLNVAAAAAVALWATRRPGPQPRA